MSTRRIPARSGSVVLLTAIAVLFAYAPVHAVQTVGLFLNTEDADPGYTLWTPRYETTYLIDNAGKVVHSWDSAYQPGNTVYLLPSSDIVRAVKDGPDGLTRFTAGGFGGRVEKMAWDGTVLWSFLYATEEHRLHHDIAPLPNGNVLMIAWELKSEAEALQAGRDPALFTDGELWPDTIIEVDPSRSDIVWEWHVWDHLVQDFDPTKDNFDVVADHPELLDVNHVRVGGNPGRADWMHANAIDYNAELDQIMLGTNFLHELYVIDHSTTTAEAAGHTGGDSGKGGDFLYRWGNPQAYDRGLAVDQTFYGQHHPHWIDPDLPGGGNILVYNNGRDRPEGDYSTVDEFAPPVDEDGNYTLVAGQAYGPDSLVWTYVGDPPTDFYSGGLSGAQRLPNGNTLICEGRGATTVGQAANFFEVTTDGDTVWRYVNPVGNAGPIAQGGTPTPDFNSFRVLRYPLNYAGLVGQILTPGDPLETFNAPPVPTPTTLGASRLTPAGDEIEVTWDAVTCTSFDYNLIYGNLADVSTYALEGSECAIGTSGTHTWLGVPAGDLYFVVVGVDDNLVYESSWGTNSSGAERNGTFASNECGATNKINTETCP